MNKENGKEVAQVVVNEIKTALQTAKKNGKKNPSIKVEVWRCTFGMGANKTYYDYVEVNGKKYGEFKEDYQVRQFWASLGFGLEQLRQVRGFGTLEVEKREVGNYPFYWDIVDKVTLLDKPCKEFTQLKNYIARYGNCQIEDAKLYVVGMWGKRGEYDTERGGRRYLCHDAEKCATFLTILRRLRGTNDKMTCHFGSTLECDENERQASRYYECECYDGEKLSYLDIEVTTPSGKQKGKVRIY